MGKITYIDEVDLTNKKIFMRVDFNVSLSKKDGSIKDDTRIKQTLPTLKLLLEKNNRLILSAHLGKPKSRDPLFSLGVVAKRLQEYLPDYKVIIVNDFLTDKEVLEKQTPKEILLLENIRFYPEEKKNDPEFAKKLAALGEVYVNDGFGVSHREAASVVGVTQYLPSYGGLLLKKEVQMILKSIENPQRPVVAIIGGAKISTKIGLIKKLMTVTDSVLIGGAMANTLMAAQGLEIGKSLSEAEFINEAKILIEESKKNGKLITPTDVICGNMEDQTTPGTVKKINELTKEDCILDIGPETIKKFQEIIASAKTIIWNGPVGLFENPVYAKGTDAIYDAVVAVQETTSVIGGGDTLTAIAKKDKNDRISHISTGGGAMLELIEKGTLPGLEALKK